MEDPHILRNAAIGCQKAFRECLSVPSLNDDSWAENKLGDFNLWITNLRVLKPGHASLDYRLREKEDLRNVIAGLLQSLHDFVERCCVPEEPKTGNQANRDVYASDDSVSSWSDISDGDDGALDKERASISILSDPISGVKTTLDKLIRLGMLIRKSGDRFRHDLADRSLGISNYEEPKRHLEFLLSKGQESEEEPEDKAQQSPGIIPGEHLFVARQRRLALARLTDFQRRGP